MAENGLGHLVIHQNVETGGYDNEGFTQHNSDDIKRRKSVENEEMQEIVSENGHLPSSPTKTSLTNGFGRHSPEPPSPTLTNGSTMIVVNCEVAEDNQPASHRNSTSSSNQDDDNVNLNVDTSKELKCPLDTKLHHYVSVDAVEGKMLNSGESMRIDIPDDAVINFNTGRIRVQNQQNKNHSPLPKVCHENEEEKIPMQEMSCSLASLQEDSEKALEAAQNGRSSDEYSTDTAANEKQGNGGGPFDEYFIPVNTHKKYLRRGEKLYLTKDSEKLCQNWRRVIVCGLITIVIAVAILVGVLAATGILLAESESKNTRHEVKDTHVNDLSSVAVAGINLGRPSNKKPSKLKPQTTAEIPQVTTIASQSGSQLIPIVPDTQPDLSQTHNIVPNALVGEFTIVDENFTNDLGDHTSHGYLSMATHVEDELSRIFKENRGNFHELRILQFRPGSIIVQFVVVWRNERGVIPAKQANQIMKTYFKNHGNRFLAFQVNRNSLNFTDVFDECRDKKGGCSHACKWNYLNSTKTCTCEDSMELSEDGRICIVKPATSNGVSEVSYATTTIPTAVPVYTASSDILLNETSTPMGPLEGEITVATPNSIVNSSDGGANDGSLSKTEAVSIPETYFEPSTINIPLLISNDPNETTTKSATDATLLDTTIFATSMRSEVYEEEAKDLGSDESSTPKKNEVDTVFPLELTTVAEIVAVTTEVPAESKANDGIANIPIDGQFKHPTTFEPTITTPAPDTDQISTTKSLNVVPLVVYVVPTDENATDTEVSTGTPDVSIAPMNATTKLMEEVPQAGGVSSTAGVDNSDEVTTTSPLITKHYSEMILPITTDVPEILPVVVTLVTRTNETSDMTTENIQPTHQAVTPAVDELLLVTTQSPVTEATVLVMPKNETEDGIAANRDVDSVTDIPEEIPHSVSIDSLIPMVNKTIEELLPSQNSTEMSVEEAGTTTWSSYISSLVNQTISSLSTFYPYTETSVTPIDDFVPNIFNRTPAYRLFDNISENSQTEPPSLIEATLDVVSNSLNNSDGETTTLTPVTIAVSENTSEHAPDIKTSDGELLDATFVEINATTKISSDPDTLNSTESDNLNPVITEDTTSNSGGSELHINDTMIVAGIHNTSSVTDTSETIAVTGSTTTLKDVAHTVNSDVEKEHVPDELTVVGLTINESLTVLSNDTDIIPVLNGSQTPNEVTMAIATMLPVLANDGLEITKNISDNVDKVDVILTDESKVPLVINATDIVIMDNQTDVPNDNKDVADTVTKATVPLNTIEEFTLPEDIEIPTTSSEVPVASTETPVAFIETTLPVSVARPTEPANVEDVNVSDIPDDMEIGVLNNETSLPVTLSGLEENVFMNETEVTVNSTEDVLVNESATLITSAADNSTMITTSADTSEVAPVDSILTNETNTETTLDDPLTTVTETPQIDVTTPTELENTNSTETPMTNTTETTIDIPESTEPNMSTFEEGNASNTFPHEMEFFGINATETPFTSSDLDFSDVATDTPMTMADFEANATMENLTTLDFMAKLSTHEDYEMYNTTLNDTVTDVTEGIVCRDDQFLCISLNVCLNNTFICDGIEDCPEGVDESDCVENCNLNFKCDNSSVCIMKEAQCDGVWDCDDGSDEQNCTPTECAKHEVMCLDGSTCIKPGHICDWKYNCRDRSDEVGCVERTTCETGGRFFCNDGLCIPWSLKCDGAYDCKDREDEGNCTCLEDEFKCNDGKCLKSSSRCDGHKDCIDSEDEMGCVNVDTQGIVTAFEPYSGSWSLICAEDWNLDDGHYLCQELGFGHALTTEKNHVSFNGTWMSMKRDNLTAASLWTERVTFAESCSSNMAASVMCQEFDCGNYSGLLHRRRRKRQSDGLSSPNTQWPFIAYVSTYQSNKGCLSEILTPVWLVTSAECLLSIGKEPHNGSDWYVRTNIAAGFDSEQAQNHEVLKITPHPHSSKFRSLILRDYDVALVRLRHSLVFSEKIGAICLPEEQVPSGITCFSGVLGSEKPRAPPPKTSTIGSLALMLMDKESCNTPEQYNNQINSRMLCTKSSESQSICDNDEGTPLMCLSGPNKWYLAGMLTYQRFCGVYNWHPAVFSNLFAMRNFIDQVTGQKQYSTHYDSNMYIILPPTTIGPTEGTTELTTAVQLDFETTPAIPSESPVPAIRLSDHELYSERHEVPDMDSDYNTTDFSSVFNTSDDYFMMDNTTDLESMLGIEMSGDNVTVLISTTLGNMTVEDDHTLIPEVLPLNGTQKLSALKHPVEFDYYSAVDPDKNNTENTDINENSTDVNGNTTDTSFVDDVNTDSNYNEITVNISGVNESSTVSYETVHSNENTTPFSIYTLLYNTTAAPFAADISDKSGEKADLTGEESVATTVAATVHQEPNTTGTPQEISFVTTAVPPMSVNDITPTPEIQTTSGASGGVVTEHHLLTYMDVDDKITSSAIEDVSSEHSNKSLSARMLPNIDGTPLTVGKSENETDVDHMEKELVIKFDNMSTLIDTDDTVSSEIHEDSNNTDSVDSGKHHVVSTTDSPSGLVVTSTETEITPYSYEEFNTTLVAQISNSTLQPFTMMDINANVTTTLAGSEVTATTIIADAIANITSTTETPLNDTVAAEH